MISGKNLSCWAVILTFLIGAANSSAQSRSETLFWADPRRDNIWRENARESLPNEEEINQINQKVASLVDEFGDSQYIVREKAVKKFAVWFIDAATTFTAREIIKQELSKIAKNEELELDARYRSAALLKIFPHIERGEEYGIEINSCELPGGEIIITEDLENYCRLIDNFERLLNNPDSVDFPCLVKNGNRIFPFLLKILENPSSFTYPQYLARHIAIRILGKLGGAVSVETLAKILNNDKEPVFFKYEAAKYLAEIGSLQKEGSEIAIDELITVLKKLKSNWWSATFRMDIMELIKKVGGEKAVRALSSLLSRDEEPECGIRALAAIYLGQIGDPKAIDALTQAVLSDPSEYVRTMAERSLNKIREKERVKKELDF